MVSRSEQKLVVGTRTSKLALWQTHRVIELLKEAWPHLECEIKTYVTEGDEITDTPLPEFSGRGVFTTLLEHALHRREIDIAVHSLKDLPLAQREGLTVAAVTTRADARDGLIARNGWTLASLPRAATVGTSSLRRQAQLLAVRDDLQIRSIRGNVDTRVRKVAERQYDATVLAAAGLERLGLTERVTEWLPFDVMLPAPGQGALAVQCRADDTETYDALKAIDDAEVWACVTAERKFLEGLGGGCSLPIAAFAERSERGGQLRMSGLVISPDGCDVVRVEGSGEDGIELGKRLAREAIDLGARRILSRLESSSSGEVTQPGNVTVESEAEDESRSDTDPTSGKRRAPPQRSGSRRASGPLPAKPLAGRRVVVTRALHQAQPLVERLSELGATAVLIPAIHIVPVADMNRLDAALRSLADYDWVVFTSVNAVEIVCDRMAAIDVSIADLEGVRVSAVGPSTSEVLVRRGITPAFVPEEFVGEAIARGLGDVRGRGILLPRAEIARKALPEALKAQGALVDDIAVYRTLPADFERAHIDELNRGVDAITFTSASTVRNFVAAIKKHDPAVQLCSDTLIACIGPVTAQAALEAGFQVDVVATEYTSEGLLNGLVQHFQEVVK